MSANMTTMSTTLSKKYATKPTSMKAEEAPATNSNVREAFLLMSTLIYPQIPVEYLELCTELLQRRHMESVFEERAVQSLCGFPPCGEQLNSKQGKFRVSLAKREIYEADEERKFCSQQCLKKARVFLSKLVTKPPQLLPSLHQIFGTSRPNPFQFQKQLQEKRRQEREQQNEASAPAKVKTVWSKAGHLGVVERKPTNFVNELTVPSRLSTNASIVKENSDPEAPERQFPDAQQAVLIEGYVFPAHKQRLATKVEKVLQRDDAQNQDEVIVSDSEESEVDDDDDGASSCSSFELTDDEDGKDMLSSDGLPLFANLWRMFASWITHETNLLVADLPLPVKPVDSEQDDQDDKETKERKATEDRMAKQVLTERLNAFSMMLDRNLSQIASKLQLRTDRYIHQRLGGFLRSFKFPDPIDGRQLHEWTCIVAILLVVAHKKQLSEFTDSEQSALKSLTRLDERELKQLLNLFYEVRDEQAIVEDDESEKSTNQSQNASGDQKKRSTEEETKHCRKCRRTTVKCVCRTRTEMKPEAFSTEQLASMMDEALTLRQQHEELLEAAEFHR